MSDDTMGLDEIKVAICTYIETTFPLDSRITEHLEDIVGTVVDTYLDLTVSVTHGTEGLTQEVSPEEKAEFDDERRI